MKKIASACVVVWAALVGLAQAEIVKTATVNCKSGEICFYWWPKLPDTKGWHAEQELNYKVGENGSNVLIPEGQTFSSAPAIIYARAIFAERYDWKNKTKSSLASFIEDDKATFRKSYKGLGIAEIAPLKTGDGQFLKVITYFRPDDKTWECVAYGAEDGNYLMFVLSARSMAAYEATQPVFQDLIARYRK